MKNTLEYWKDKFEKLISFLHDKLHSWYDKDDKYIDVVNDMYEDNVLDDDDIEDDDEDLSSLSRSMSVIRSNHRTKRQKG